LRYDNFVEQGFYEVLPRVWSVSSDAFRVGTDVVKVSIDLRNVSVDLRKVSVDLRKVSIDRKQPTKTAGEGSGAMPEIIDKPSMIGYFDLW
jgi:hypothetical protein